MKVAPTGIEPTLSSFKKNIGVLLFYGDSILLSKRINFFDGKPVPYGGYWAPFAGAVEAGELPIMAAVRELWEEAGKKIEPYFLTYITEIYRENAVFILYAYELEGFFSPTLNCEHTEYGYFQINTLQRSPSPICLEVVRAVQDFDKERRWARTD